MVLKEEAENILKKEVRTLDKVKICHNEIKIKDAQIVFFDLGEVDRDAIENGSVSFSAKISCIEVLEHGNQNLNLVANGRIRINKRYCVGLDDNIRYSSKERY